MKTPDIKSNPEFWAKILFGLVFDETKSFADFNQTKQTSDYSKENIILWAQDYLKTKNKYPNYRSKQLYGDKIINWDSIYEWIKYGSLPEYNSLWDLLEKELEKPKPINFSLTEIEKLIKEYVKDHDGKYPSQVSGKIKDTATSWKHIDFWFAYHKPKNYCSLSQFTKFLKQRKS